MAGAVQDLSSYERKRDALRDRYLDGAPAGDEAATGGVDHLALICSDLEATIAQRTDQALAALDAADAPDDARHELIALAHFVSRREL